ncbi:hypothetical protein AWC15_21700 [Mycobacterium lacus]|nr:hypothetical protein AWC15_21700 [Mycobacterium lacus]
MRNREPTNKGLVVTGVTVEHRLLNCGDAVAQQFGFVVEHTGFAHGRHHDDLGYPRQTAAAAHSLNQHAGSSDSELV